MKRVMSRLPSRTTGTSQRLARKPSAFAWRDGLVATIAAVLAGCASAPVLPPASELPLSKEAQLLLGKKGMTAEAPIFVRIFKEESELEVWKQRADGRFYHFKTYPICNWSGELGPKLKQGDKQAPEGFYTVASTQLNPNSSFYLAYNLGFPNAYDRSHDRSGDFLMVHGKCKSAGCYAMTDALMEEIYALSREALRGGQKAFHVHAFPFRMTEASLARHAKNNWMPFWKSLKDGYDAFEVNRIPPEIAVCERKYVVNVVPPPYRLAADGACPRFDRPIYEAFVALPEPGAVSQAVATAASPTSAVTASSPLSISRATPADVAQSPAAQMQLGQAEKPRATRHRSAPDAAMNALGFGAN